MKLVIKKRIILSDMIFGVAKLLCLTWTVFFAGALDKWKAEVLSPESHVAWYALFWFLMVGIGALFAIFLKTTNFEQVKNAVNLVKTLVLLPVGVIYALLLFILSLMSKNFELASVVLFTSGPILIGLLLIFKWSLDSQNMVSKVLRIFKAS
jgi:ABC-type tungstate transport system substrate-binding protein